MTTKIVSVVAGPDYSLALSKEGYLFGWGNLSFIGLNNEKTTNAVQLGFNKYKMVSGGLNHIMAIDMNDVLYGWGNNIDNQLGYFGTIDGNFMNDLIQTSNLRWKSVSCGNNDTAAITLDGDLYTFGNNSWGQLGDNTTISTLKLYKIDKMNNSPWKKVLCGLFYKIALNEDGQIYGWGRSSQGVLSNTQSTNILTPTIINNINGKWTDITVCNSTTFAINEFNQVYVWGWVFFENGELKTPKDYKAVIQTSPLLITNLNGPNIKKFNSNFQSLHFMLIYNDNSLYTWGINTKGQLGRGTELDNNMPVIINETIKWIDATGSETHSLAVDIDGNVYTCGSNNMGQLGNGYIEDIIEHNMLEKINIPSISTPIVSSTAPPSVNNPPNNKKIIIIVLSVILPLLFIILITFVLYKLNHKYKYIERFL